MLASILLYLLFTPMPRCHSLIACLQLNLNIGSWLSDFPAPALQFKLQMAQELPTCPERNRLPALLSSSVRLPIITDDFKALWLSAEEVGVVPI